MSKAVCPRNGTAVKTARSKSGTRPSAEPRCFKFARGGGSRDHVSRAKSNTVADRGKRHMELWELAQDAKTKTEGFSGPVRLFRLGPRRPEPSGTAADVGNASQSVCDRTRKARDGRGGHNRCLRASGDSAEASRGIEQPFFGRADQFAQNSGFDGGDAGAGKPTGGKATNQTEAEAATGKAAARSLQA